jgi:hypothetical protein
MRWFTFIGSIIIFAIKHQDMNIQTEKLGLIEWLSKLNDATIIERL